MVVERLDREYTYPLSSLVDRKGVVLLVSLGAPEDIKRDLSLHPPGVVPGCQLQLPTLCVASNCSGGLLDDC